MQDSTTLSLFGTGQITLPKKWRKQINAKNFVAVLKNRKITLTPIDMDKYDLADDGEGWENIFSARDTGGVPIEDFLEAFDKIKTKTKKNEQNRKISKISAPKRV